MARLPEFLTRLSPVGETLAAAGRGVSLLEEEVAARNAQLSVSTADTGLSLWETDYGLPADAGTDRALRRGRIQAALAGGQTLTRARLAALAVAVADADSGAVDEDFPGRHVTLWALYEGRLPENAAALEEAVGRLGPAHLRLEAKTAMWLQEETGQHLALSGGMCLYLQGKEGLPAT